MRILHYYPKEDTMIAQHVQMLSEYGHCATEAEQAKTLLQGGRYDILHLHGCWRNSSRSIVNLAMRQGCRLVVTPHGGLEPWVQEEQRWKEKLPKRILYQRSIIRRAYAVIIQGKMEDECMQHLGWNPRTVIIRNAVITHSTTPQEMAAQTLAVYRKVMDSNQLELMNDEMRDLLHDIIMAGITGDRRWLTNVTYHSPITTEEWRQLLCYAHQEEITDTIQRGIRVLGLECPDLDVEKIDYYLPADYKFAETIGKTIGNQFATENDRLMATFKQIRKLVSNRQLGIKHLIELDRELRQHGCEEELLAEDLKERRLIKLASRIMYITHELTGLTEGFMPVTPLNDRISRAIRRQVDERLKI